MLKQLEIIIGNCGQIINKYYFILITGGITKKTREYMNDNVRTSKRQFGTYISKIQISKCSTTR